MRTNIRRPRLAFILACLVLLSPLQAAHADAARDPIEGKWYGMAGFPQDRQAIGYEFKRDAKGALKAYWYQPVMNFYGLELPCDVERDGDAYKVPCYLLTLSLKDGKLSGTYLNYNAPIELSRAETLPTEAPLPDLPKGPGPRWVARLGAPIYAPAAVADGVAYVGTTGGLFHALSLKDGSYLWSFAAGRPIYGEALVTADAVYFPCDDGYLFKLDRATGKELWRYDLGDERSTRVLPHLIDAPNSGDFDWDETSSKPVLADGAIYAGSGIGMHAVDPATGKRLWFFPTPDKVHTDPVVSGKALIFGASDGLVYALDLKTGQKLWDKNTYAAIVRSVALVDGKLVLGNRGGLLAALDPADGKTLWKAILWGSSAEGTAVPDSGSRFFMGASDLRRVSYMDAKDGTVLWRTDVYGWTWPKPALSDKFIYLSVSGGHPYDIRQLGSLTALDRKTGKIAWRWPMPEWPGYWLNGFVANPTLAGKDLVVGGLDGSLYAFPAE